MRRYFFSNGTFYISRNCGARFCWINKGGPKDKSWCTPPSFPNSLRTAEKVWIQNDKDVRVKWETRRGEGGRMSISCTGVTIEVNALVRSKPSGQQTLYSQRGHQNPCVLILALLLFYVSPPQQAAGTTKEVCCCQDVCFNAPFAKFVWHWRLTCFCALKVPKNQSREEESWMASDLRRCHRPHSYVISCHIPSNAVPHVVQRAALAVQEYKQLGNWVPRLPTVWPRTATAVQQAFKGVCQAYYYTLVLQCCAWGRGLVINLPANLLDKMYPNMFNVQVF